MQKLIGNMLLMAVVTLALLTGGCKRQFSISAPTAPTISSNDYSPETYKCDVENYEFKAGTGPTPGADCTNYTADVAYVRNKIIHGLMGQIDAVYGEYSLRLYQGKGAEAIGFDSFNLALSSAATIATHAATKTLFSALGSGITGVGLSVDKNVFSQQTFQVLAIAMQTRRDKFRASIMCNIALDSNTYPLASAKRELISYYYAGTLPGGLQELQEEAGKATAASASGGAKTLTPTQEGSGCTSTPAVVPPVAVPPVVVPPIAVPPVVVPPIAVPPVVVPPIAVPPAVVPPAVVPPVAVPPAVAPQAAPAPTPHGVQSPTTEETTRKLTPMPH